MHCECVTVALHPALLKLIRVEAERTGQTVAEWLADTAARALPEPAAAEWRREALKAAVEEYESEFGEITDAERAAARALWQG